MGTPETLARRERRRRKVVREFLLDALESLDGVEYVAKDAQEGGKDAPGTLPEPFPGSEAAFGAFFALRAEREFKCWKCRDTGLMPYRDAGGDWDVDVCDCVLDREPHSRQEVK